jgi:hypothetical protein
MKYEKSECPCCKKIRKLNKYRRLCRYNDDETNWLTCCAECKKEDDAHWKEMWKDY